MGYFTVPQILSYAKVSLFLASQDTLKGKLFKPMLDPNWARTISLELHSVEWAYNQSPAYTDIQQTANYLYNLLYKSYKARNIINGGGGGVPIVPVNPIVPEDCTGVTIVTAADFEADGKTVYNADWANKNLTIFWNNIPKYIFQPDWLPVIGGGFTIVTPSDFDANNADSDCVFVVMIGCFNPGAIINPYLTPINTTISVTGVETYDLTWTPGLQTAYGKGSFQVYQDYGGGVFEPSGILPTADDFDNPSVYYFTGLGSLPTRIVIS